MPAELFEAVSSCHAARRSGADISGDTLAALFEESEAFVTETVTVEAVEAAWIAIGATGLRRVGHRLLGARTFDRAFARDRRCGWPKIESTLRRDRALPTSFRANPAQHFYALQNVLAERQRQQWREECDREPDSFELAA